MALRIPPVNCKIEIFSSLNPSEDSEKVKKSIYNVLPNSKILSDEISIIGESSNVQSLEKIYESIHSKQSQRVFQRQLKKHVDRNTTWFYLNKQTAFVKKIVLCEEADESPLGPLKVVLTSPDIDRIIDFLVLEG